MTTGKPSLIEASRQRILVWDLPVRLSHWLMVACFAGAWITAEEDQWRRLHAVLGYTMALLAAFRIFWGVIGTRHAKFKHFVRGPRETWQYVRRMLRGNPPHYTGHNPAGAVAIVALLAMTLAVTFFGWLAYSTQAEWLGETHEVLANLMIALVGLHVAGALAGSWLHRENLVRAMVTGRKLGRPDEATERPMLLVALIMLACLAEFWWLEWIT
ncbi:cytochrome b/b6 domain-containing protein [Dyella sp. BiH032]|uniref:cytochrome b/b6 domain-containing protein n=1 Tax=Dyella sp. BiH032 TaxID=3075430 RepID=UPI00289344BE|nr:cytochrome b/b6 domain-containing protein [Dyella sp. BiH032]WNL44024.1 cytochrome b/b6 domain-containing protein [Dyella sp. BiH032]